jgi:hypothetical protein
MDLTGEQRPLVLGQSSGSRENIAQRLEELDWMIAVLVPHKSPPRVLNTTREAVVLMVRDTSATGSYIASMPPGSLNLGFDDAWSALTKDMTTAKYFETVEEALAYYESVRDGLSLQQHARIIDALKRLGAK